jgi:NAD(P)-dependent dehydrogenase (short-subunit alcohol dehydrogenase family)
VVRSALEAAGRPGTRSPRRRSDRGGDGARDRRALVRSLAVEYASRGIRIDAIAPGPTETELMWANVDDAHVAGLRDRVAAEVPIGRLADPREPALAALWLLSVEASYVTGAQLAIDGGVLARASVSV